jgi:phosphoribosyl-ATP pyrophosphohydrolase
VEAVLTRLAETLEARKGADPETSYVARLYEGGLDMILKKIGEEATELVIAAKTGEAGDIVHETADLWFHTLVMLSHVDVGLDQLIAELERRAGVSGLEEKASRGS